jgi:hypothetical protein
MCKAIQWVKSLFIRPKPVSCPAINSAIGPKIVIVDHDVGLPLAELQAYAAAQLVQINNQFALPLPHGYGAPVASIRVADAANPPQADEWELGLFKDPDLPDALGYHTVTPKGMPVMKVFPLLDAKYGLAWTVTASHEILETLADPLIRRGAQDAWGRWWAFENCDSVQSDTYLIDGVAVSNFVLPPYFEPPAILTGVKFDWMGLVKKPLEIRPGGYGNYYDHQQGWVMVGPTGARATLSPQKLAKGRHGRTWRRLQRSKP